MCPVLKDLLLEAQWENKEHKNIVQGNEDSTGLFMKVV